MEVSNKSYMVTLDGFKYDMKIFKHSQVAQQILDDWGESDEDGEFPIGVNNEDMELIVEYEKICIEEERKNAENDTEKEMLATEEDIEMEENNNDGNKNKGKDNDDKDKDSKINEFEDRVKNERKSDNPISDEEIREFKTLLEKENPPYRGGEFRPVPVDLYKPVNYDINEPYWMRRIPKRFHELCKKISMPELSEIGAPTDEEIREIYGDDFMDGHNGLYATIWIATYPYDVSYEDFAKIWGYKFLRSINAEAKTRENREGIKVLKTKKYDNYKTKARELYKQNKDVIGTMKQFHETFQKRYGLRYPCHNHPESPLCMVERVAYAAVLVDVDSFIEMMAHLCSNKALSWMVEAIKDTKSKGLKGSKAYYNESPTIDKIKEWCSLFDDKTDEEKIECRNANMWVYDVLAEE